MGELAVIFPVWLGYKTPSRVKGEYYARVFHTCSIGYSMGFTGVIHSADFFKVEYDKRAALRYTHIEWDKR